LALYLLPTLLSLIIFALGLWLRPLFEKNWPDLFTKNETQPVSKVGISVKEEFVPSATPKDLAKNLEPRPTVTENVSLIPSKSTPTAIELDYINFEYNYCRQVIQLYKKKDFWIATNQQPIPLLREDFFVSPQFSIEDLPKRNVSLRGLLKLSRHLLLLGVPGAGKTETIMSLLLTYARHEAMLRLKSNERLVPILLSVPDVSQQLSATPNLTLSDVLQQKLTPPHKEYVVEKLEEGHFLILVDNFNEIVMTQAFQVADWFEKQIEQFPKNRMVIVIRPFLKEVFNQTGPFTRARFDNLGDDMLKTLTKKWKAVIPDALNTLASIVQEENVYPLAHTPLHLSMLLIVGLTTRTLPNHKTQLYAYYIKTLLAFGQQENTPPLALLSQAEKHYLLQRIAYNLHTNRAVEIEESALNKLVQQILTPINVKVADEAHVFIEFLRRSGLLIEKNCKYLYAQLINQEFFTEQGQDISEVFIEKNI
jgi:predicted NACHT family NTPase